jgi:uridine phosphorylase
MELGETDGVRCGVIARTIGGPYAVLVAEQLAAPGARVVLGLTSAGRVSLTLPVPTLVVAARALRDKGTPLHDLPPEELEDRDAALASALAEELGGLGLRVRAGTAWTTDAPCRETAARLERHAASGMLAVEMQAASLFAFGAARGVPCGVVAHVTNGIEHSPEDQFNKGTHEFGFEILKAMARAGRRRLRER